jgi:hypothetical protein
MTDDDINKINARIDEKLARRRQQQQQQQQTSKLAPVEPSPPPPPPPATTMSLPSYPIVDTPARTFNNDEYSIFRDPPVSRPTRTTVCMTTSLRRRTLILF